MTVGDLIHRITIETRTETSDGHDGFTETWTAGPSRIAALVRSLAGRDLERAHQIDPRASHELTLRFWQAYDTDLDGGRARVIWHDAVTGDRTLELVEPPREVSLREWLAMVVREQL